MGCNALRRNRYGEHPFTRNMATILDRRGTAAGPPPTGRRPRHHAPIGIGLGILAWLIGVLVLGWAVLFVTKGRFLKHTVENLASSAMHREVRVAGDFQLYFDIVNIRFVADGLTVANPSYASRPFFLSARHLEARVSTIRLIFGQRHLRWLNLDGAAVDAEWDKAHRHNSWTFGDPSKPGKPFQMPVIERATVTGTSVRFRDPQMQLSVDQTIDTVRSTGTRIADSIGFHGTGTLRGNAMTDSGVLLTPNSTVTFGRTNLRLTVDSRSTHIEATGTLPAATQLDGAEFDFMVRGPDARQLFDMINVAIPDTRAYRFTSHLKKDGEAWRFWNLKGRFGDSDLAGDMTILMPGGRLKLVAGLHSQKVDIVDIGPFIGYDPNVLATKGATAAATTQTGKIDHPRILPDAPLRSDAIKLFDARVDYVVKTIRAPHLPVSNVHFTLDLDHSLLALSPMTMDVAGTGHLAADIGLNARGPQVVTDYDIRLSPTSLGTLTKGFGLSDAGTTGTIKARIKMKGTGDSLRQSLATANGRIAIGLPHGTFITSYAQLSEFDIGVFLQKMFQGKLKQPITINCGLIAFTVTDGVARTDPVLIDTDKNVMTANGGFSFKDESLNLEFRSRGKKFSAFSGQSPVGIGGYFAAPKLHIISGQLVARVGAAVALGVVATPIAPVLAFIDFGRTPDTACGPVLAGATAAAQHTEKGGHVKGLGDKADNKEKAAEPKKKFLGIF